MQRCSGNLPFCLGMTDFNCCGSGTDSPVNDYSKEPEAKKKKLSLSTKKPPKKPFPLSGSDRFNTTISAQEIEKSSKGFIPANTSSSTNWDVRVFLEWLRQRNKHASEVYPIDLLNKPYPCDILCECLQQFVSEARREDGREYPPRTLYQLLCGLLRHTRNVQRDPPNFLDRKDVRFKNLHGTCDVVFRSLHENGIGTSKKSAQILTKDHEDKLWKAGVLNSTTPKGLQNAVFYYVGKTCCLRGGEEQRNLKLSQFTRFSDPDRYIYSEHSSKNRNGGFNQFHIDNKNVPIFKNNDAGE